MKGLGILVFLTINSTLIAQKWQQVAYFSFKKEYTHLLATQPKDMYKVKINTSIFETTKQAVPKVTRHSELTVYNGNNYSFQSEDVLQMQQEGLKMDIDTVKKQVVLSRGIKSELLGYREGQFDHIDSTGYRFFRAVENNKIYLKVEEITPLSSMQTVSFIFNKTSGNMQRMELLYWPSNYNYQSLDNQTLEQPKVCLDYSTFDPITTTGKLTQAFNSWLTKDTQTGTYSCPKTTYTFYDLSDKK